MDKKTIKVLLVDDDANLRATLCDVLKIKGFVPVAVQTGSAALALVDQGDIDTALIDLRLEDMPGLELLRLIKQHSPDTECILLTGYASQDSAIQAINLGAYSYYQKPFNIDQLLLSIRHAGERRAVGKALAESETHYRGLFEESPISLWEEDFSAVKRRLDGLRKRGVKDFRAYLKSHPNVVKECAELVRIVEVNRTTLELYRARSKEDLLNNLSTVLCDESYEQYREELVFIAEGRSRFSWEGINQALDGRRLDVSIFWSAAPGHESDLSKVIVSIVDITERKRAEEELRKLSRAVEQSPDSIVITDPEGTIEYVNPNFTRLTGYSLDEVIGTKPSILKSGHTSPKEYKRLWDTILSGNDWRGEFLNKKKDGGLYWESATISPITNPAGKITHFLAIKEDITQRKQAEEAYHAAQERFRALVERSADVITLLDANGNVLYHSPAYSRLVGRTTVERQGKSVFEYIHLEDQENVRGQFMDLLAQPRHTMEVQARLQHKDGTYRWIEGTAANLLDDPAVQAIVINYRDVTGRRTAEDKVRQRAEELAALQATVLEITAQHDPEGLLQVIVERAARLLKAEGGGLYLCDPQRREVRCVISHNTPRDYTGIVLKYGEGAAGTVAQTGQPLKIDDYRLWSGRAAAFDEEQPFRVLVSAPMLWQGQVTGVIHALRFTKESPFTQEDQDLLALFANHAAIATENARLLRGLQSELAERRRAEEELRAAEAKLRALVEEVPAAVYTDEAGTGVTVYISPQIETISGYSPQEWMADKDLWERIIHPEERERVLAEEKHSATTGEPFRGEYRIIARGGGTRWVRDEAVLIRGEDGTPLFWQGIFHDITDMKEAEESRREAELRYRALFEQAHDAIFILNLEGRHLAVNPRAAEMLGYTPEELLSLSFREISAQVPQSERIIQRLLNGEHVPLYERLFRKKNGEPVPVEINVELVRDAHGRPLHIHSVVRDISERKRAEEELRQSEEKIQNIIRHSSSMFYTHTPDHVLTYVSPQSRDILDCEPEEAMVRWQEFLSDHPNNIEGIEATERAIQTGQRQPPYELELITHKGRRIWVRVDESPILRDGKTTAIVGSITDITERKLAEAALQESEKFLRQTIDLVPHFIFSKDIESRFLLVNKAVAEAYGTTTSDIVGKSDIDFSATPEQARHFHEDDVAVIKEGKPKFIPEEPITDAQGNTRYLQTTKIPFRFGLDNVPGILGVSVDITERRKAQTEIQQRVKELEVLYESGLTLSRLLEPQEIGQKMIELLSSKLDWHHAAIRLYHPDTESVEVLAVSHPGMTEEEIEGQRQRLQGAAAGLGKGLSGWVIKHGKSVRSGNVKADKRYLATFPEIRSGVYVPIQAGGRTIGSIAVESEVPDAFTEQDERILATLASQSAVAFENARLYQEALHAAERRAVLHRASREIAAASLDLEAVYASIHRAAADLMPFEVILVGQHDRERQEVEFIYTFDSGERYPNARIPVGQGITGRVIQKRASMCIRDYRKEKRDKTVPFGKGDARSILAVPMFAGDSITGVISVQSYQPGLYSQEDQALLEMLAAYASAAIENARLYEQAQRRLRESESLGQASQALSRSLEIQPLMENILAAARRAIPAAEKGTIVLQEANGELRIRAMAGYQDGRLLQLAFTPGTGFVMQVFEEQQPSCIDDVHANFRVPYANEIEEVNTVQSAISAPLTVKGEKIGVISLDNASRKSAFTNDDLQLLVSFASSAAVAIQNSRLYEQTTRRAERLAALSEVSQKLSHLLDLESIGETSVQAVESLLGWKHGSLWLVESDARLHMLYHSTPGFEGKARQQELQRLRALIPSPGEGIIGWVVQHGEIVRCADVKLDARYIEGSTDTRSELCVPLQSGGKTIGALNFESENENAFGEEDEQVLSTLAGEIAGAIERAHLFNQTQRRAGELGALAQVSSALRTATTRAEMIPVILDQLTKILRIDNAALLSYDPPTGENVVEVARGKWTKAIGMRVPSGEGVSGVVAQTQLPFLSDNVIADKHFAARAMFHEPEAVAGMPLLVQKQFLGSLWMGRQKEKGQTLPFPFAEEEIRLLGSIADMTANALHRARLHEQAVRHADQMLTVNEIGHMLSETLDLEQVYTRLTGAIHNLLPDVCGLYISLYNERNQTIICTSAQVDGASVDVKQLPPLPFDPEGKSRQSRVLLTGEALIVNDMAAASRQKTGTKPLVDPKQKPESALYVPMSSKGTPIGLIQVQSYTPNRFGQDDINLLSLVANTAAITIENARLFAETRKRLHYLSALHNIDAAISASVDLRVTLSIILENITKELNVDAAALLLMNAYSKTLEYTASRGFRTRIIEGMRIRLGEGLAGQAAIQRRLVGLTDADQGNLDLFGDEKFTAQFAVPLIAKGQVQGVLQVFHRSALEPDLEWTSFLNTLAGQAAIAMDNARLFEDLQRSNLELTLAYDATIQGWSQAMELRDKETQGHTNRVTELTMRLAREIGLSDAETVHLRRGVLLHDIGKMGVPDAILLKPGSLTEEEWEIMRMHPVYAFEMLSGIPYLHQALDVPYCHHEKWDGSGYPRGLKEEQIPISARLFAVVDVYDAVTSDRPYRSAWTREQALEYLREQSGKHFDPQVVDIFLKMEM